MVTPTVSNGKMSEVEEVEHGLSVICSEWPVAFPSCKAVEVEEVEHVSILAESTMPYIKPVSIPSCKAVEVEEVEHEQSTICSK